MTKYELIQHMAAGAGITQVQAKAALVVLVDAMTRELKEAGEFTLWQVGRFNSDIRPARIFTNPQNGEIVRKGETYRVKFKPSGYLLGEV